MAKRKVRYPPKVSNKRAPAPGTEASPERPNLARINLDAGAGRQGFKVGDRVVINASGTYSGETAVIERLIGGVIPSAFVRTGSGGTRQVRTIDLAPAPTGSQASADAAATDSPPSD